VSVLAAAVADDGGAAVRDVREISAMQLMAAYKAAGMENADTELLINQQVVEAIINS
jgi:hypothetical protein